MNLITLTHRALRSRMPGGVVTDQFRDRGVHIIGRTGSGKSVMMGQRIAVRDFACNMPVVVVDPTGETVKNFLHRLYLMIQEADGVFQDYLKQRFKDILLV